jgi:alpha-D-xyloside xylohydrolase
LVKKGSIIPHIALAQSTEFMDWSKIELVIYDDENKNNTGLFYQPNRKMIEFEIIYHEGKRTINFSEKK